jgi:hypothetical protein
LTKQRRAMNLAGSSFGMERAFKFSSVAKARGEKRSLLVWNSAKKVKATEASSVGWRSGRNTATLTAWNCRKSVRNNSARFT